MSMVSGELVIPLRILTCHIYQSPEMHRALAQVPHNVPLRMPPQRGLFWGLFDKSHILVERVSMLGDCG